MSGAVILIILVALLFGIALTTGVIFLVLKLIAGGSGWSQLAARYGVEKSLLGMPVTSGRTVVVGVVCFRRSMTVGVWPRGLYLSTVMARQPVLIPWSEFTGMASSTYYLKQVVRFTIGSPPHAKIAVFMDLYASIMPYLNPTISGPP